MARKKGSSISMPDAYRGREQAFVKHGLLKAYLEKLFLIVGMSSQWLGVKEICYVDCFAGPWLDDSESLDSTSIAVSLRILARCRRILIDQGKDLSFRALYVEKDPAAFTRLQHYVKEHAQEGVQAQAFPGDFVDLRQQILDWCGTRSFALFFIDPTAWTPVSVEVLRPLLERPQSEFLINFMYDFISRAVSMEGSQVAIELLLGESPIVEHLHGLERERALLGIYRRNLKKLIPTTRQWPARSAYVRILDPEKNRPKYHLVYLTGHPRGIVVFMEISEKLDLVQKRVRAQMQQKRRIEKTGTLELFDSDELVRDEEGHVSPAEVERLWRERLSVEPRSFGWTEFAEMLEETDWFPGDFQRALTNLIKAKVVHNLDAPKLRPRRPLHYENGERLQLIAK